MHLTRSYHALALDFSLAVEDADLASYLQRVSALLRQGEPVAEVALYAPSGDAWSTSKPGTPGYLDLFVKTVEWIGPDVVPAILELAPRGHAMALQWTALADDDLTMQAAVRLARATDWPGLLAIGRDFHAPQQI